MKARNLTDEQVEQEIAELRQSPYVKLARKSDRLKYVRRQVLYNLRNLEKRGRALAAQGVTDEGLNRQLAAEVGSEVNDGLPDMQ